MLDIEANRSAAKYTTRELALRALWSICRPLFRFSPRVCFSWRALLLRLFGARLGRSVHVYPSVDIFAPWDLEIGDFSAVGHRAIIYNLGHVRLGSRVTISQGAHLCAGTHDYTDPTMPLVKLPIVVSDDAWVCADAFVGPGVTIGDGAVVGARAVVVKNVEPWTVVVGSPARPLKRRMLRQVRAAGESRT